MKTTNETTAVQKDIEELKKYIDIDENANPYGFTADMYHDAVLNDEVKASVGANHLNKYAIEVMNLIYAYHACKAAGDPITSKAYIERIKDRIKTMIEYYGIFKADMARSLSLFNSALKGKSVFTLDRQCKTSIAVAVDFLKRIESKSDN